MSICVALITGFGAKDASAQFHLVVRQVYKETIRAQLVPKIAFTEDRLKYHLPSPSGFDPTSATPLEVAGVEQARVEAIRMYRMNNAERRNNWNSVLPSIEAEIRKILAIDRRCLARQPTDAERKEIQRITEQIDGLYASFFDRMARQTGRVADGSRLVEAYPIGNRSRI